MKKIIILAAVFTAGSYSQYKWDQYNIRKKAGGILERAVSRKETEMRQASVKKAIEVHNLHVDETQKIVQEVADLYAALVMGRVDVSDFHRHVEKLDEELEKRYDFISTIVTM